MVHLIDGRQGDVDPKTDNLSNKNNIKNPKNLKQKKKKKKNQLRNELINKSCFFLDFYTQRIQVLFFRFTAYN